MRPSDTTHGEPYKRIIGVLIGGERFSLSSLSAYRIYDQKLKAPHARSAPVPFTRPQSPPDSTLAIAE